MIPRRSGSDDWPTHEDQITELRGRAVLIGLPSAPACTALVSTGSVGGLLIDGTIPPDSPIVWPLVVLALGSMAYDLGHRALRRRN